MELEYYYEPLSFYDLEFFNRVRNSAAEFLHDSRTFTLEETKNWFMGCTSGNHYYLIKRFDDFVDYAIGYFRLSWYKPEEKSIYIGMDLDEKYRGQGLATEIYQDFMKEINREIGIELFKLEVLKTNVRAINLYKKLGFVVTEGEGDDTYDSLYMELKYEK